MLSLCGAWYTYLLLMHDEYIMLYIKKKKKKKKMRKEKKTFTLLINVYRSIMHDRHSIIKWRMIVMQSFGDTRSTCCRSIMHSTNATMRCCFRGDHMYYSLLTLCEARAHYAIGVKRSMCLIWNSTLHNWNC